ncbi:hypothetical protein ACOMICROBIO_LMKGKHOH_02223 [Vibrio sp. B1FIG11]|uniref:hypothetical protein n=1 Tax=Vibrio sp. B1FIG11 TaxID=2751177 RepID=UPI001AF5A825|nr:hypothetical protein [Vibrio sp. B1FIG11]CAD7807069.1 hypothetical protein ACOMICROBIO_LMKGKHOH_02223 [Vibrio sp. B1FIG11]CAE6903386.1 hypothetical protein ACOMICROBIO_LMKGKHOH_02223 [Vibrio sp. B1FIG11]
MYTKLYKTYTSYNKIIGNITYYLVLVSSIFFGFYMLGDVLGSNAFHIAEKALLDSKILSTIFDAQALVFNKILNAISFIVLSWAFLCLLYSTKKVEVEQINFLVPYVEKIKYTFIYYTGVLSALFGGGTIDQVVNGGITTDKVVTLSMCLAIFIVSVLMKHGKIFTFHFNSDDIDYEKARKQGKMAFFFGLFFYLYTTLIDDLKMLYNLYSITNLG